ncbi:hypothetical protein [Escherichia coli]
MLSIYITYKLIVLNNT